MGMDYHVQCLDCNVGSQPTELSIVGYIQLKHPDEAESDLKLWIAFLTNHSGHRMQLQDSRNNPSDPCKIKGDYVLGIKDFDKTIVQTTSEAERQT